MHISSSWIRKSAELILKSFVIFSRYVQDSPTKILLNHHPKMNWFHLSSSSVTLESVICYLRSIQIKCTSLGENLLLSSIDAYLGNPQKYGALILEEVINQDIKDSKAFKTYLDFSTRKATPKKVRKFKKIVSPSKKLSPVLEEEPAKKPKRAKKPAKKSTIIPTIGVVIRDTPSVSVSKKKTPAMVDRDKGIDLLSDVALIKAAQLKKVLKKSKQGTHILHASGSSKGANFKSEVPDEPKAKSSNTSEGIGLKPGVPNVSKANYSKSENESWGDSEDDDDSVDFKNDDDDDDVNSEADGNTDASDSERTDSDKDENPTLNLKDDEEEEYEEELKDAEHKKEGKRDVEMTDAGRDDATQEKSYEQVEDDTHVTLTAAHVTKKTEGPMQSSSVSSDLASQFLNLDNTPLADNEVVSMMNVKKAFRSYTAEFKKKDQAEKKKYIDLIENSVKDIIKDEVKTQLPQILPKKYLTSPLL
ncbi:hypothetical protein Tco_0665609 [Tanacetum coccineum]